MAKQEKLNNELEKGEKSGYIIRFNRDKFISNLHKKYIKTKNTESKS